MLVKKDKVNEYKDIKDFNNKKVGHKRELNKKKSLKPKLKMHLLLH